MVIKEYKKMLNMTSHQGNAIKTIRRYHLTLLSMAIIEKTRGKMCWQLDGAKDTFVLI